MQTSEEVLKEYIDFEDVNGSETVELLPLTIVDCMEEYTTQRSIDFGRWLLANVDIKLDSDGAWIWEFGGECKNTAEMFEIYLNQ